MTYKISIILVLLLVVSACTPVQENKSEKNSMDNMPCHQMPDGSWMGKCDEEDKKEDPMNEMPCHQMPDGSWMGKCDEEEIKENEKKDLASAKPSSTIIPDKKITLEAKQVSFKLGNTEINGYGYNGEIPGPTLKVKKDQKIQVEFKNSIPEDTTVHWHGLRHDIKDDGMPGVSQPPVKQNEDHLYNLYFPDEGLFWYHPHIREDRQQDLGLAGLIRVGESSYEEEYIVLDDLLIENDINFNYGEEHANFALMGRYGNKMLINGKEKYEGEMKTGEIKRFFFANVANARPFRITFEDANMKQVGGDIGLFEKEISVDEVIVGPAERVALDIQYLEEGIYSIIHKSSDENYIIGEIKVSGELENADFSLKSNEDIIQDIDKFREYFDKEPDYILTLDIEMDLMHDMPCHEMGGVWMGDCDEETLEKNKHHEGHVEGIEWEDEMKMINLMSDVESVKWKFIDQDGNINKDIMMNAKIGDKIKIRLINTKESDHPMQHPIHLHGQRFLITSVDGKAPETFGWEDTILVEAGSTADILVDVTNPGEWMIHCHIAEHLESGMMAHFMVEA